MKDSLHSDDLDNIEVLRRINTMLQRRNEDLLAALKSMVSRYGTLPGEGDHPESSISRARLLIDAAFELPVIRDRHTFRMTPGLTAEDVVRIICETVTGPWRRRLISIGPHTPEREEKDAQTASLGYLILIHLGIPHADCIKMLGESAWGRDPS